jgi:hypothetical protein
MMAKAGVPNSGSQAGVSVPVSVSGARLGSSTCAEGKTPRLTQAGDSPEASKELRELDETGCPPPAP